jgi:hypothetical protein
MDEYQKRVKHALLDRQWFKFVDALEEFTDTYYFGRNTVSVPKYDVYVPPRQHIMKRPDLGDHRNDEASYQFGMSRLTPYHYHNTLKGKT